MLFFENRYVYELQLYKWNAISFLYYMKTNSMTFTLTKGQERKKWTLID